MISIATSELREFKKRASNIRPTGTLPILEFLKLETNGDLATLTVNNLKAFVVHEVELTNGRGLDTILIEQKPFYNFLDRAEGDFITFTMSEKNVDNKKVLIVHFTDGVNKGYCQSEDPINYPIPQTERKKDDEVMVLNSDVLVSLSLARTCVDLNLDLNAWVNCVHLQHHPAKKESVVFSCNMAISYIKKFQEPLPELVMFPNDIAIIADFSEVMYRSVENYYVFETGKTTYGFVKNVHKTPDYNVLLEDFTDEKTTSFVVAKKSIINYCELVNGMNPSSASLAYVFITDDGENQVKLDFENIDYNTGNERILTTKNKTKTIHPFTFVPKQMLAVIKGLPYDELTLNISRMVKANGMQKVVCYVTSEEDKGFIGLVIGIEFRHAEIVPEQEPKKKKQTAEA